MISSIQHIWFDFSETIVFIKQERHEQLIYETYAELIGKPVSGDLITAYKALFEQHGHSNSAVFRALGKPASFWSDHVNAVDPRELYEVAQKNLLDVLQKIKTHVPISLFSNIEVNRTLTALGINPAWFAHILSAKMAKEPKPALDGFYKIVELSALSPEQILYVGDNVVKDVLPAKNVGLQTGIMWKKSEAADYSFEQFEDILKLF